MKQDITSFAGPDVYGMTGTETVNLRPGLAMQIAHVSQPFAFRTEFAIHDSPVIFGFLLAGLNCCRYLEGPLEKNERIHSVGSNGIAYLPDTAGVLDCKGGMHRLSIIVSQEILEPYISYESGKIPMGLRGALSGAKEAFHWAGQRSTAKMRLISEIFTNAYSGSLRRLHLETRTLELMGLQLREYLVPEPRCPHPALKASDISRIKDARAILIQDMENPPSMAQLARMAGINEKKLKIGFKQLFGMPAFEYFRNYRLDIAKELIASGMMSVTEVGMHIGYQNMSHFSAEFRKKFGISPKKFQSY
ncbi:helix-turn-helix transcriptional regulator [Desulfonatronum thiodismutans]|uniref:helix-turn-helix transcriptional regulator n=1 Tax=Desulfonatronum thiodismutans TaxID=159290 RepID=UPI001F3A3528|nr:AraC family transcriptional regulator [Desulfonatronum thiodismutans]